MGGKKKTAPSNIRCKLCGKEFMRTFVRSDGKMVEHGIGQLYQHVYNEHGQAAKRIGENETVHPFDAGIWFDGEFTHMVGDDELSPKN